MMFELLLVGFIVNLLRMKFVEFLYLSSMCSPAELSSKQYRIFSAEIAGAIKSFTIIIVDANVRILVTLKNSDLLQHTIPHRGILWNIFLPEVDNLCRLHLYPAMTYVDMATRPAFASELAEQAACI
jgi:hypothetical protein